MSIVQSRIYLASQSPRRRELLKQIGINFEILLLRNALRRNVDVDETPLENEVPIDYVQRICRSKAIAGWNALMARKLLSFPVLAADTAVIVDDKILGKPRNYDEAASYLRLLSGRPHQVLTAVGVTYEDKLAMRLSTTKITFAALDEERIHRYLLTNEGYDKAGAYGIQGHAAAFVAQVQGSYSGVMGLPLFETVELLRAFGHPTP